MLQPVGAIAPLEGPMSLLSGRSVAALFASIATLFSAQRAEAALITLQNDGFVDMANVGFQGGFVTGEMGGSTLGPVSETYTVQKVTFLYGPTGGGAQTITLRIYADTGADAPGTQLFDADYQVTPSSDALQEIDLSADNVVVAGGSIRVAILFQNSGAPSIARDDDGSITSGRNWIYTAGSWTDSENFALTGDWIIRAEVETAGTATTSTTGAGGGGGTTSATGSGGGNGSGGGAAGTCTPGDTQTCVGPGACDGGQSCNDAGTGWSTCECAEEASGCGCKVPAEPAGGEGMAAGLSLLGLAATVTAVRRRRRRR